MICGKNVRETPPSVLSMDCDTPRRDGRPEASLGLLEVGVLVHVDDKRGAERASAREVLGSGHPHRRWITVRVDHPTRIRLVACDVSVFHGQNLPLGR